MARKVIQLLQDKGYAYEQDGALWFKSTIFGDDKDRVLVKSNGSTPTTWWTLPITWKKSTGATMCS